MLQISNLSFSYGKSSGELFNNFSLDLQPGNVYGLLGKNGAGKSTLIYLMTGLLTPKDGVVTLNGDNVRQRLPKTLNDLFLVPEEFDFPNISLSQFVKLNSPFYPRFSVEDMNRYLDIFEMERDARLHSLSMGQRPRHPQQEPVPQNCSPGHERRQDDALLHSSGARHRADYRPCRHYRPQPRAAQRQSRRCVVTPRFPSDAPRRPAAVDAVEPHGHARRCAGSAGRGDAARFRDALQYHPVATRRGQHLVCTIKNKRLFTH